MLVQVSPHFTYNAQCNVNIVDWYGDGTASNYHNHENTSHFDCLSTHLYIQDIKLLIQTPYQNLVHNQSSLL